MPFFPARDVSDSRVLSLCLAVISHTKRHMSDILRHGRNQWCCVRRRPSHPPRERSAGCSSTRRRTGLIPRHGSCRSTYGAPGARRRRSAPTFLGYNAGWWGICVLVAVLTTLALAGHVATVRAPCRRPDRHGVRGHTDSVELEESAAELPTAAQTAVTRHTASTSSACPPPSPAACTSARPARTACCTSSGCSCSAAATSPDPSRPSHRWSVRPPGSG
jgi:hypothetical protein